MADNFIGYTYKELAELLRKANPGMYNNTEDVELVNSFKESQPNMFDSVGGWDKAINEPGIFPRMGYRLKNTWDNLSLFGLPAVKETVLNAVNVKPDEETDKLINTPGSIFSPKDVDPNQFRHLNSEAWQNLGQEHYVPSSIPYRDENLSVKYKTNGPHFSMHSNEFNTYGLDNVALNNYWANKENNYNMSDALNGLEQQKNTIRKMNVNPESPQFKLWASSAMALEDIHKQTESIDEQGRYISNGLGEPLLVEGMIETNERNFANLVLGPDASVDEKENYINSLSYHRWSNKNKKGRKDIIDEDGFGFDKALEEFDKKLEDDMAYKAWYQYTQSSGSVWDRMEHNGIKELAPSFVDALSSMLPGIATAITLGGTNLLARRAGLPGIPLPVITEATMQMLTLQDHIGSSKEAIQHLTKSSVITPNQYEKEIAEYEKELRDKKITGIALNNILSEWKNRTYSQDENGNILKQGISTEDALYTTYASRVGSSIFTYAVEKKLGFGRLMKQYGNPGRKYVGKTFGENFQNNLKDRIQKIPGANNIFKSSSAHISVFKPILKNTAEQSLEEGVQTVGQTWFQSSSSPLGYKEESYTDLIDWNEISEAMLGGALLGGGLSTVGSTFSNTELSERFANWKVSKMPYDFFQNTVQKLDNGNYGIFIKSPTFKTDEGGAVIYDDDGKIQIEGEDSKQIPGEDMEFSTFREAFAVAEAQNNDVKRQFGKLAAKEGLYNDWANAKTKIKKISEDSWTVDVLSETGNVLKTVTFNNKNQAQNFKSKQESFIADVELDIEEAETTKKDNEIVVNNIVTEDDQGNVISVNDDLLFLAGNFGGRLTGKARDAWEEYLSVNEVQNEKDVSNPDKVLDIIKRHGWDALNALKMDKPTFMENLTDWEYDELFPEAYNEIDNILTVPTEQETTLDEDTEVRDDDSAGIGREDRDIIDLEDDVVAIDDDIEITPEEESKYDLEVDESFSDLTDEDLREEYLKSKVKGDVESALKTTNLRTELKARGLSVPRVTKKVKERLETEAVDTRRPEEVFDAFETDEQKAGKKFAQEFLNNNKGSALGLMQDLDSKLTNELKRDKISKEFFDAAKKEMKRLAEKEKQDEKAGLKLRIKVNASKQEELFEKEPTGYENLKDDELIAKLKEFRKKVDVTSAVESTQVLIELKRRGIPVPKKDAKQIIDEQAQRDREDVLDSKERKREEREKFVDDTVDFLKEKFIGPDGKPLFNIVKLNETEQDLPENKWKGRWEEETNTMYLNPKYFDRDTALHEFAHPFIRAIANSKGGVDIINSIYDEVVKADKDGELYDIVMKGYVETGDFEEGSYEFKEELIAWALGRAAKNIKVQSQEAQSKNKLIIALKKFWKALKEIVFGKDAPLYHELYNFVKDGVTFDDMVSFLADSPDKISIQDLSVLSLEKANSRKGFELIESNPIEDNVARDFNQNYLLPAVQNEVLPAVISISKTTNKSKRKLKISKFRSSVIENLRKKFNIPKNLNLDEYEKESVARTYSFDGAQGESNALGISKAITNWVTDLQVEPLTDFNIITDMELASMSKELAEEINKIGMYVLNQVRFKYQFVNILGSVENWSKESINKKLNAKKTMLPAAEKRAIKQWMKQNIDLKDNNIVLAQSLIESYKAFVNKKYPIYTGIQIKQDSPNDYIHIDSSLRGDLDTRAISASAEEDVLMDPEFAPYVGVPSERIMFFTSPHSTVQTHRPHYADFPGTDKSVGATGWYRVSSVPGYDDIFASMEYQSDYFKNIYRNHGDVISFIKDPEKFIESKMIKLEDTNQYIYSRMAFNEMFSNVWNGVYNNIYKDKESDMLLNLPDNMKKFKVKYKGKFLKMLYDNVYKTNTDYNEFLKMVNKETQDVLLHSLFSEDISRAFSVEFIKLIEKGKSVESAWNIISNIIENEMIESVETTHTLVENDKSLIKTYFTNALSPDIDNPMLTSKEERQALFNEGIKTADYLIKLFETGVINDQLEYHYKSFLSQLIRKSVAQNSYAYSKIKNKNKIASTLKENYEKGLVTTEDMLNKVLSIIDSNEPGMLDVIVQMHSVEKSFHKIRVLHSIQNMVARQKPNSTSPVYISLGAANALQQTPGFASDVTHPSYSFYATKNENAWNNILNLLDEQNKEDGNIVKESINLIIQKLGDLWNNKDGISNEEFMNFFSRAVNQGNMWYGKSSDMVAMQDFIIKEMVVEDKKLKGRDSSFFKESRKVLNELQNAGLISWKVVTPEWGRASFIEITPLNRPKLLGYKGSRFQKVLDSESIDLTKPNEEGGVYDKVNKRISYQKIDDPRLARNAAINHIFKEAWIDINRVEKQARGFNTIINPDSFRIAMLETLPTQELKDRFVKWYQVNIIGKYTGLKYTQESIGKDVKDLLPPDNTQDAIVDFFNDPDIREGMHEIAEKNESDEREINANEYSYDREFGKHVEKDDAVDFNNKAYEIMKDPNIPVDKWLQTWVSYVSKKISKRSYTIDQQLNQMKKFNRLYSNIAVNTENGNYNERNQFYAVIKQTDEDGNIVEIDIQLKGPDNITANGSTNSNKSKITPFEMNNKKGVFSWIDGSDFLTSQNVKDNLGRFVEETYEDRSGIIQTKRKKELKPRYEFFNAQELEVLETALNKMGFTIALSRGDSSKLGIVSIDTSHLKEASSAQAALNYFRKEIENGSIPMGEWSVDDGIMKNPHVANMMKGNVAANIAVHEAFKKVFPNYLSINAATFAKRIKLPFTPMTISPTMPNVTMYIANKENLVFKYRDKEIPGFQTVQGVDNLYIGDGGSVTAKQLFEKFEKHHGLIKGQAKAKTVIYRNQNDEGIAVKHQHYQPESFIEIWEGDTLLAKVDKKGNFTEGKAAGLDMIITDDEAKWMYGADINVGNVVEVSGQDIGFTKYSDKKKPQKSNHLMQWYSFVYEPEMIQAFKDYMLQDVKNKFKEAYRPFAEPTKKSSQKAIKDIISKIDSNDAEGFRNTLVELNNLGVIWQIEPMLNVLYQNKVLNPKLRMKEQPGTKADLAPNLRGDLNPGEAALSKENADEVYLKYAAVKDLTLAQAKTTKLSVINDWLKETPVNMFIARTPVPHVGGTMLIRIKRLHDRKGLVELHPYDVFARLEGDYDGDWITMESLPWFYENGQFISPMENSIARFFEGKDVKGINLGEFDNSMGELQMSNRFDRYELIEAMTYNKQGEVANIINVYGTLVNTVNSIEISGRKILIKPPNEKRRWGAKVKRKPVVKSMGEILRYYMQASVDNAKYMLLSEWGYTQDMVTRALFKYENGQTISEDDYESLKPLIKFLKSATNIMRGQDFTLGKYNTAKTIALSGEYYAFTQNKNSYVKENIGEINYDTGELIPSMSHVNIDFKNTISPVEEIAILPYVEFEIWQNKFDIIGAHEWPGGIHYNVHRNAHIDGLNFINDKPMFDEFFQNAISKDRKENIVGQIEVNKKWGNIEFKSESDWALRQWKFGEAYTDLMAFKWYNLMNYAELNGKPNFMEQNQKALEFKTEFNKRYKKLSSVSKMAATYSFLNGAVLTMQEQHSKAPKWFPPSSDKAVEFQLLEENILSNFVDVYNDNVGKNRNMNSRFDNVIDLMYKQYIKESCG